MLATFGYVLVAGMFFSGILFFTSADFPHRQRLIGFIYLVLSVIWIGFLLYLKHSKEYSPHWLDEYEGYSVVFASALPLIIGFLINNYRIKEPVIMRLRRTPFRFSIGIILITWMLWIALSGLDYYKNDLYFYFSYFIPMTIAVVIMVMGNTVIYESGILAGGILFLHWTDFESYQWKNNRLKLLLIKKYLFPFYRYVNIRVHPEDEDAVKIILAKNGLCETFNINEGEIRSRF